MNSAPSLSWNELTIERVYDLYKCFLDRVAAHVVSEMVEDPTRDEGLRKSIECCYAPPTQVEMAKWIEEMDEKQRDEFVEMIQSGDREVEIWKAISASLEQI